MNVAHDIHVRLFRLHVIDAIGANVRLFDESSVASLKEAVLVVCQDQDAIDKYWVRSELSRVFFQ